MKRKPQQSKPSEKNAGSKIKQKSNSVKYTPDPNQLVEIKPIEGTPFAAIKTEKKWHLVLGKYRLTNELDSYEQCLAETMNTTWERIMQVIQIMIENQPAKTVPNTREAEAEPQANVEEDVHQIQLELNNTNHN
ncbi:MAG: hypothetical protein [Microviridae sp.]|nr:MAG: hypothetical protein [Microviridae sp.]